MRRPGTVTRRRAQSVPGRAGRICRGGQTQRMLANTLAGGLCKNIYSICRRRREAPPVHSLRRPLRPGVGKPHGLADTPQGLAGAPKAVRVSAEGGPPRKEREEGLGAAIGSALAN